MDPDAVVDGGALLVVGGALDVVGGGVVPLGVAGVIGVTEVTGVCDGVDVG